MKLSHVLKYALPVGAMVLSWITRSMRDGKITQAEIGELVESIGELIGEPMTVVDEKPATPPVQGTSPRG